MKIRLIDEIKEVWTYSSMRVQYMFGALITAWIVMPEEHRTALLNAVGVTQEQTALFGAVVWLVANVSTRTTVIEKQ